MNPRVGIASVGLGRIQRGYERYFDGIFNAVRNHADITLYKGGGISTEREKVPPLLQPFSAACGFLPLGIATSESYRKYKHDCLAFALAMAPDLLKKKIDVIHVIDHPLAKALLRLRTIFRFRTRVIFSEGGLLPPEYYPKADHVHHTARTQYENALAYGYPAGWMTMIPCGLWTERFRVSADASEMRRKHGIGESTFVILAVSAINRGHKRVHHIIEEASRVQGDFLLWIDGRLEDEDIGELARTKLGSRCRISHVATADIPNLYSMSDLFVHGALEEGFGLAICEAASAGLNVLVHNSRHFEWLVGDASCLVDMSKPGPLSDRLQEYVRSGRVQSDRNTLLARNIRDRFDWDALAPQYVEMYRKVAGH